MSQSERHAQPLEPHRLLVPGQWLRHYELIRGLSGDGRGGRAFLARDTRMGRRVTLLLPSQPPSITTRLSHENIAVVHEVGQYEGEPFLVLEYLQGQSVRTLVRPKRLPPARAVELMVPVVRALAYAHDQGVVHGDLKPDNILVTDTGVIKVLGFGLSPTPRGTRQRDEPGKTNSGGLLDDDGQDLTPPGTFPESLAYRSPEQWGNGLAVDHRTDLWAVGIMLFQMLSGRHPLGLLGGEELSVTARLDESMPRLQALFPALPRGLAAVVDRCLLKNKDERFADARALLHALEPFLPGQVHRHEPHAADPCPYPGLSAFQEADADRFFGRAREVAALRQRIQDRPLLAVVGPSGAGKTSLVRAGLVPALKRSGNDWETLVMRPGQRPLSALARLLEQVEHPSDVIEEDSPTQRELVRRLYAEPGYAGQVLRASARRHHRKLLVFIDPFEELYARVPDARERRAFTECLLGIADDATSPLRVLLTLRTDRMDPVSEDERFMAVLSQGLFFLAPPRAEGLCEALVRPAERAGYSFEMPILVDGLLQDLESSPDALPLLQFAATTLWEARDPDTRRLTVSAHETLGGITGVLARHADGVLANLLASEQALARRVCSRLVTPERTRAHATLDELRALTNEPEEQQRLIEHLIRMRLLRVHGEADDTNVTVELVHESLIHGWPPLRRWLDERQEDTAFLEHLEQSARRWREENADPGLLWSGERLQEARRFQRRSSEELPPHQRDFLEAVFTREAREARRGSAQLLAGVVLVGMLFLATSVAWEHARGAQRKAELQAETARAAERVARDAEASARDAEARAREAAREAQRNLETALLEEEEWREEWRAREETHQEVARLTEALIHHEEQFLSALRRTQKRGPSHAALRRERERVQGLKARLAPMLQLMKVPARGEPAGPSEETKR